jgi:hypothetical protein
MTCQTFEPEALAAWRAGELSDVEARSLEEHVFECDDCGRRLEWLEALVAALPTALGQARGLVCVTNRTTAQMRARGCRLREYQASPGERVPCTVGADDDFLVTRLRADLAGVTSVELALIDPTGRDHGGRDLPVDRERGEVVYLLAGSIARHFPDMELRCRLSAGDRTLGEYRFVHTAYRPR